MSEPGVSPDIQVTTVGGGPQLEVVRGARGAAEADRGAATTPEALLTGFVGSQVVRALDGLGIWAAFESALTQRRRLTAADLAVETGCDENRLVALLQACELLGYLRSADERLELTQAGCELIEVLGYFTVAVAGFGAVFRDVAPLARGQKRFGVDTKQDMVATAVGCAQNRRFQQPILERVLSDLSFDSVLDLGCGDGHRLLHLARHNPTLRAVGVDISLETCDLARRNIAAAGLTDRITVEHGDVRAMLDGRQRTPVDADLVMSFFLFHHFFADAYVRGEALPLLDAFPGTKQFLLGDAFALPQRGTGELPIFSLGFDLFHRLTDVALLEQHEYYAALYSAGLQVCRAVEFGHPQEWLIVAEPAKERLSV